MNDHEFAKLILAAFDTSPTTIPAIHIDEGRRKNAGRCMTALACNRLAHGGEPVTPMRHSFVEWMGGVITIRNCRVGVEFWTNVPTTVEEELHSAAQQQAVVYLFVYWDVDESVLHSWAVPESVFAVASASLPANEQTGRKTLLISLDDHILKHAAGAPSFAPFYLRSGITEAERNKLAEAIKTDDNVRAQRADKTEEDPGAENADRAVSGEDGEGETELLEEPRTAFTDETVAFLLELPAHADDGSWHDQNKRRYQRILRDPTRAIVEEIRTRYIQRFSPAVAGGKRHLSILRKNDYGRGGYYDHYWFAFYDPAAGSKTKSVQLFLALCGKEQVWRYGVSMGEYCGEYLQRLVTAILTHREAVAAYLRGAPADTVVRISRGDNVRELSPLDFAQQLLEARNSGLDADEPLTNIDIIREYPLGGLPNRGEALVDEVGAYFTWAWPFFDAAVTSVWATQTGGGPGLTPMPEEGGEVDESAPRTIAELAKLTCLSAEFLEDLEDALLAKQQAVLIGPPGTSKTFLARQFARYFVRQRQDRLQGSFDVLYMHASWRYEDFFEGLKPASKDGVLTFEPRMGFFLRWVERLKEYSPQSRHVLVLDEINRCDTAAVLGELLQLLEYRGTTVQLLSGRSFVFPRHLFIIGTMNSADRSIGRLDLALQRRFFQIKVHPQLDTLDRWLKRPGNNPLKFQVSALARCNELLGEHGIPPEQQIGHALFMLQRTAEDDEVSPKLDKPLSEKQLRQIVRFSVLPYVRELLTMQFGQTDANLLQQISDLLLHCVEHRDAAAPSEPINDQPAA